jgi:hypothetical protein
MDLLKKIDLVVYPNGWSGPVFCISAEQLIEANGQEVLYEAKPVSLTSGQVICTSFVLDNKQYIHVDLYWVYSDLVRLIEVWPQLSEEIRKAIVKIIS